MEESPALLDVFRVSSRLRREETASENLQLTLGWDHAESITSLAQLARSWLWLENCCVKVALSLFWIVARTRRIPPATQPFPIDTPPPRQVRSRFLFSSD